MHYFHDNFQLLKVEKCITTTRSREAIGHRDDGIASYIVLYHRNAVCINHVYKEKPFMKCTSWRVSPYIHDDVRVHHQSWMRRDSSSKLMHFITGILSESSILDKEKPFIKYTSTQEWCVHHRSWIKRGPSSNARCIYAKILPQVNIYNMLVEMIHMEINFMTFNLDEIIASECLIKLLLFWWV